MEEFRYGEDGSFLSGTFADYPVPTACEVPEPVIVHVETPSPFTPLGAKGIGEGNNMSTPVCIANALADALSTVRDIADLRLPLTPAKMLGLIGLHDPPPSAAGTRTPSVPEPSLLSVAASPTMAPASPAPRESPLRRLLQALGLGR
jgi:2-furoyl-CoA dehydrogenase large subunit